MHALMLVDDQKAYVALRRGGGGLDRAETRESSSP
jgi:hypothetical protein